LVETGAIEERGDLLSNDRPIPVGIYQLLQDFECPAASVRVFRLEGERDAVGSHVHRRSAQVYVALRGTVMVDVDGVETVLAPYQALAVWPGEGHSASAVGGEAVLMNISVPPLRADDQVAVAHTADSPDLRLPREGGDIED
jgi:mannose-6-phosphate isomerase-like protein (cupin superfamily)